uniref:EOG090X098F n=1 Tax=Daphnia sinensis TaxID=1820382 RepID=A0A4Y7N976_9CRUS|nr:EOG090X098F [Daphnia sinensis]
MTTQDWTRMLKSFRTKTYRNLTTVEDRKAGSALHDTRSSSVGLCDDVGEVEDDVDDGICQEGEKNELKAESNFDPALCVTVRLRVAYRGGGHNDPTTSAGKSHIHQSIGCQGKKSGGVGGGGVGGGGGEGAEDKLLAISSITGLQQQIKAAFGRWRKRGTPSSPSSSALEEEVGGPIREDCFDHPLNVRLSAQSQTFSHPHRLTVFPPFPSGGASPSSSANVSPARTKKSSVFNTSATPSTAAGGGGNSKSGGSHPFSFVRGLRKRRAARAGEASDQAQSSQQQHRTLTDLCSDRLRSRTAGESGWPNCTSRLAGQDHFGPFGPLTAKSRSDHSLHRILKEDNTWTVFATLRPPSDKGGSLSKGTTAWTFGLFSDSASQSSHQRRQTSTPSVGKSTKSKAASVAPSPELVHRAFTPCFSTGTPSGLVLPSSGGFFGRNERRTRSLERCSQQRVRGSGAAAAAVGASWGYGSATGQSKAPPPIPSRVRSRSLEKNYTISTTAPHCNRLAAGAAVNNATSASHSTSGSSAAANSIGTPLLPVRRNNVPPEVLATWCTFNEAFGGGRPKHHHRLPTEPLTVNDERDSPGSPVFEELFLPPPQKFAAVPPPIVTTAANPTVAELVNNNNNNKRNSVGAASCCCCSSCSGGHSQSSAGVSCSSKSTPRSSPVPPTHLPETVLYGTREAPVLERHCVEGGEFIIAWLSHSNGSSQQQQQQGNPSSGGNNRVGAAALVSPPSAPLTSAEMQSSTSSSHSATAATGGGNHQAGGAGSSNGSNRSFINKPARGWLHSDAVIVREGITYFVRYIGCLEVNTSMKSLDFDTRSQIAKECINIVCETAGLKTVDKKRKVDRRIQRILGDAPHMEHAGSDVALTISSGCLRISTLEGSAVVACHDMPNISFASGGDPDTLDFVAYVAKDNIHGRACYVLECGGGLAQDVITTIGQAFELRFKEYLKRTPRPAGTESVLDGRDVVGTAGGHNSAGAAPPPWSPDDPEYYNDLPGKVPPDVGPPPVPPLPNYQAPLGGGPVATGTSGTLKKPSAGHQASDRSRHTVDLSDNLIDLNADVSSMGRTESGLAGSASAGLSGVANSAVVGGNVAGLSPFPDHEYVNGIMGSSSDFKNTPVNKDPFDMPTLPSPLPSALLAPNTGTLGAGSGRPVVTLQRGATKAGKARVSPFEAQLLQEIWFHGPISRKEAEDLLKQDGDFLVRESQGSQGQYVLTGMQSGHHKHLLLVDPEGVVRTKDRTFESVSHLINFHRNNVLPIISAESVLLLKRPVPRAHHS